MAATPLNGATTALIVDDPSTLRQQVRQALIEDHDSVLEANDGVDALEVIDASRDIDVECPDGARIHLQVPRHASAGGVSDGCRALFAA